MIVPVVPGLIVKIANITAVTAGTLFFQSSFIVILGFVIAFFVSSRNALYRNLIYRSMLLSVLFCPIISIIFFVSGIDLVAIDLVHNDNLEQTVLSSPQPENIPHSQNENLITQAPAKISTTNTHITPFVFTVKRSISNSLAYIAYIFHRIPYHDLIMSKLAASYFWLVVATLWCVALMLKFTSFIRQLMRIDRIVSKAKTPSKETLMRVKNAAFEFGIDTPMTFESDVIDSPLVTGFSRQILLLPKELYPTEEMLVHEFAHLKRRDCIWNYLSRITEIMHPLQPLVGLLARKLETTSDFICDDHVIEYGGEAKVYAGQLFSLAEYFNTLRVTRIIGAGFLFLKSRLRARVERIIGVNGKRLLAINKHTFFAASFSFIMLTLLAGTMYVSPVHELLELSGIEKFAEEFSSEKIYNVTLVERTSQAESKPKEQPSESIILATAENEADYSQVEDTIYPEVPAFSSQAQPLPTIDLNIAEQEYEFTDSVTESTEEPVISDQSPYSSMDAAYNVDHESEESLPLLIDNGNNNNKIDEYLRTDADTIRDIESCMAIGEKLYRIGYFVKAEEYFNRAMEFDADDPNVRNALGLVYRAKRDTELAILYFKLAVTLKPDFAEAYRNLGDTVLSSGDPTEAWKYYRIAINLNPAMAQRKSSATSEL